MRTATGGLVLLLFLLGAFSVALSPSARAEDSETPAWAEDLHLIVLGGPASGDIEVLVNGEFAVELGENPTVATQIGDMLINGTNTLEIRMRAPEDPRSRTGRMEIQVAEVIKTSVRQREIQRPLVNVEVPTELRDGGTECVQAVSFWAGPPPQRDAEPKDRHWLIVQGAPSTHWVTVSINGAPVFSGCFGDTFFDITDFVIRGKNEVLYSAAPTCMSRPTGRRDSLEFSISTGEVEIDTVQFGSPMATFVFSPREGKPAFEKTRVFRGR